MTSATATPAGRASRRAARDPASRAELGALGLVGVAVVFEIVPHIGVVSPRHLPPTDEMLAALAREVQTIAFWRALLDTLHAWALGLAIAAAAGTVLGVVIGSVRGVRQMTASTIEFMRPIPSVALIPVAVLLFGSSLRSTLLLVVYASFWPILLQVIHGVADVDPVARDTARSYRFTPWTTIRYLLLPTALPYIMTGLRLSAAIALILAITAELTIGAPGLGAEIGVAFASSAVPTAYALILVVGLIGVSVNVGLRDLERRTLAWHSSVRLEAPP